MAIEMSDDPAMVIRRLEVERDQALTDAAEWKLQADRAWADALAKVPSRRITFVLCDEENEGVAIKQDGEVVWREGSFDRLDQYLRHLAPLGQMVTIEIEG